MAAPPSLTATSTSSLSNPTIATSTGALVTVLPNGSTSPLTSSGTAETTDLITSSIDENPISSSPASTLQPAATNSANGNSSASQINTATLIGIVAGGAAFLVLVFLFAIFYIMRRRKRRRAEAGSASSSEEDQIPQKRPSTSRGPSQEQPPRKSGGEAHLYEPVGFDTNNSTLLPTPTYYHDKDPSSEATTPNLRNSTLENETHEGDIKEETPLDPFSSGYIPPPSPTPSEYVMVEHTAEQPFPPRTSRDKRESRTSLRDTIVPEEGTNGFATLDSLTSGRTSHLGHRRTRSGDPSGSGTTTPPPSRPSNRLKKPRPSIESTSSLFFRSTSPTSPRSTLAPIAFPRDPFEASVEEESVGPLRASLDRPPRSSYEMREMDGQSSQRPSVSARPSLDTVGASTVDKASYSRKKSHIRSPSSPTRILPNSSSFLGVGSPRRGASSSVLSLQHQQEHENANGPYINSATMADASVYDFDIYRQPHDASSHPPPASAARLSAAINADIYGSIGSKKRFSASMSDLPAIPPSAGPGSRFSASMSTSNLHAHGKEVKEERKPHESTINLYIPKESLDLPPSR